MCVCVCLVLALISHLDLLASSEKSRRQGEAHNRGGHRRSVHEQEAEELRHRGPGMLVGAQRSLQHKTSRGRSGEGQPRHQGTAAGIPCVSERSSHQ